MLRHALSTIPLFACLFLPGVPDQTRDTQGTQDTKKTRPQGFEKQLQPLAFLVGVHEGSGRSQMGPYVEGMSGHWALGKTAIVLQSVSKAGGMTVFADMRVVTYDSINKRIRVRQFAFGGVCTYTAEVQDDGSVVLNQDAMEGMRRPAWRYTLKKSEDGFSYQVDQKAGDKFKKYVAGKLKRKAKKKK